jgi:multidrug efflux pump
MTTVTTVAGLLPLTLTRSTLWPPLAWAIISGLIASTLLTLVVIPALYRLSDASGQAGDREGAAPPA